ncbi:hypothetical protein BLNAU_13120 [Blattamonas nauphoetae]|uniref:Uncharacterized protein n=1 Tax=Blattamonas nauphoetae TaxID=2049346 RepID=A0ABQ9XK74_9EUKA|nr:hypothetical protein BLNAU_13120 [Blattamonas nauphoetae]
MRTDVIKGHVEEKDIPPKLKSRVDSATFQALLEFTLSDPPFLSQHYAIQIAQAITSQLPPPSKNHPEAVQVCKTLIDWAFSDLFQRAYTFPLIEQFFPKLNGKELLTVAKHFLRLTKTFDQSMAEREPEVFEILRNFWDYFNRKKETKPAPEPTHRTIINDDDVEDEEEENQSRTVHQTEMLRDDDDDEHPPSPKPSKKPEAKNTQAQTRGSEEGASIEG